MSEFETGGSAFPNTWFDRDSTGQMVSREHHEGMTLRDYFAAKAMASILSIRLPEDELNTAAVYSYAVADAMLAAREVQPGGNTAPFAG